MLLQRKRILYRRSRHDRLKEPHDTTRASDQMEPSTARSKAGSGATAVTPEQFQKASSASIVMRASTLRLSVSESTLFPPAPKPRLVRRLHSLEEKSKATLSTVQHGDLSTTNDDQLPHSSIEMTRPGLGITDGTAEHDDKQWYEENREVTCPYCCCMLSSADIMDDNKWRNHVKHDLDAYVCLLEDCNSADTLYNHSDAWLKHMRSHKLRWRCTAKAHGAISFSSQEEYSDHMRTKHKVSGSQIQFLTASNCRSNGPIFDHCLLCGVRGLEISVEDHIAVHLRYLALKSLPFLDGDGNNAPDMSVNSNAADEGSRSTINGELGYTDASYSLATESRMQTPVSVATGPPVKSAIPQWFTMPAEESILVPSMPFHTTGPLTPPIDPSMQLVPPQFPQHMSEYDDKWNDLKARAANGMRSEIGDRPDQSSIDISIRGATDTNDANDNTDPSISDTEKAESWAPLSNRHGDPPDLSVDNRVAGDETLSQPYNEPGASERENGLLTWYLAERYLEEHAPARKQAHRDSSVNLTGPNVSSWLEEWNFRQERDTSDIDGEEVTSTEISHIPIPENDWEFTAIFPETHLKATTEVDESDSDEDPRSTVLNLIKNRRKVFKLKKSHERAALTAAKEEASKGLGQHKSQQDDTSTTFEDPVSVPNPADISPSRASQHL
ncbi:hypothetical protein BJX65DRAFT_310002 [Aspergillus insuetus]